MKYENGAPERGALLLKKVSIPALLQCNEGAKKYCPILNNFRRKSPRQYHGDSHHGYKMPTVRMVTWFLTVTIRIAGISRPFRKML